MSQTTLADPLAAAIDLLPQVRAARDELEEIRHIPSGLARAIGDAGLFQLYLPSAIGGAETPPLKTFRVIEEFSKAEGSVGWCVHDRQQRLVVHRLAGTGRRAPTCVGSRPWCAWPARCGLKARRGPWTAATA